MRDNTKEDVPGVDKINMDYPKLPDFQDPQFSPEMSNFIETVKTIQARMAAITENIVPSFSETQVQPPIMQVVERLQSFSQSVQQYWSSTFDRLASIATQVVDALSNFQIPTLTNEEVEQRLESNRIWGQYGWTYIPTMPMTMFNTPPVDITEANKIAIKYCSDSEMEKVFDKLRKWKLNHQDLESAVFCYQNKQYKACALLLCGLIDSKLIRVRNDKNRPVGGRAVKEIKHTYENSGEKLLVKAMFTYNLLAYLENLFAGGDGFKHEPNTLNRNYIGHGMNLRSVRKRDCIQLFLALNNLMRFFDMEHQHS